MTNAQEFNTEARAFCLEQADKVVKECKECGGTGSSEYKICPVHIPEESRPSDCLHCRLYDRFICLSASLKRDIRVTKCLPCPSCQRKVKEWRKLADEFCWHEWINERGEHLGYKVPKHGQGIPMLHYIHECSCGYQQDSLMEFLVHPHNTNPTYDNPADIARALKRMGLFERFVEWLWFVECPECSEDNPLYRKNTDILTDPALFIEAGKNFLREVVGG